MACSLARALSDICLHVVVFTCPLFVCLQRGRRPGRDPKSPFVSGRASGRIGDSADRRRCLVRCDARGSSGASRCQWCWVALFLLCVAFSLSGCVHTLCAVPCRAVPHCSGPIHSVHVHVQAHGLLVQSQIAPLFSLLSPLSRLFPLFSSVGQLARWPVGTK